MSTPLENRGADVDGVGDVPEEALKPRAEPKGHPGLLIHEVGAVLIPVDEGENGRGVSERLGAQEERDTIPLLGLLTRQAFVVGINDEFRTIQEKLPYGFATIGGRVIVVKSPNALKGTVGVNCELHGLKCG